MCTHTHSYTHTHLVRAHMSNHYVHVPHTKKLQVHVRNDACTQTHARHSGTALNCTARSDVPVNDEILLIGVSYVTLIKYDFLCF